MKRTFLVPALLLSLAASWSLLHADPHKPAAPQPLKMADILAELGVSEQRPRLLVGFAAETENVVEQAVAKRQAKRVDWIVANDVSGDVMGGHRNRVHLITSDGVEDWPEAAKDEVARRLIARIARQLG